MGPDPAPQPSPALLAALTTEHFVLQSARGAISSEGTSRVTIYLGVLSSALIAVGFLSGDGPALAAFVGAALPVVLGLGILTFLRLVQIGVEDVAHLAGIQRIRRRYATLDGDAAGYFADPVADRGPGGDGAGEALAFMGLRDGRAQLLLTTASTVGVVNSMLGGVGATLLLTRFGPPLPGAVVAGVVTAVALIAGHLTVERRAYVRRPGPGADRHG